MLRRFNGYIRWNTAQLFARSVNAILQPFYTGDANNDAVLELAKANPSRSGESTVYGWDLNFNGDLFTFNELPIYAAFGIEARREELKDIPSLDSQARAENGYLVDVFGFGSSLSEADRTQYAAFVELNMPVTEQMNSSCWSLRSLR